MSNNNIFNDNYRRKFLQNADCNALNDYLKNMERLSKKGGHYLEIYNKDLDFLLELNDNTYQDSGNIFNLLSEKPPTDDNKDPNKITMTEQVCDTEGYIKRIDNIVNNNPQKVNELKAVKQQLLANYSNNNSSSTIKIFIDMIKNCDNSITQEEFNMINQIIKILISNKFYVKESFVYMGKVLDKNKVSEEFIKKIAELRNTKNTKNKSQYNTEKDNLFRDYIKKSGFSVICTSKLVEKIINAYKNF